MHEVAVVSLGPLADVDGTRGTVVAALPSAAYVATATGRLLVVHDVEHGHTPTSVLVRGACPAAWGVQPGDAVVGRRGRLHVGRVLLDARWAVRWRPPEAPARPALDVAATAGHLRRLLDERAPGSVAVLDRPLAALVAALASGSPPRTAEAARHLVGLGQGFTPAGDDALVGLLAVLHRAAPAPADAWLGLLRGALVPRLARTTPASAHYLDLALAGWFGERLLTLVDALAGHGHADPAAVLATGASSGADALAGVVAGLDLLGSADPLEGAA